MAHDALWTPAVQVKIIGTYAAALHALPSQSDTGLISVVAPSTEPVSKIAGYFQAICTANEHPVVLAYCALVAMYHFPACRAEIARDTPVNHAAFFVGGPTVMPFERRFERHLSGVGRRSAKNKAEVILQQAKTPAEIVVAERQLLQRL